MNDAVKPLPLLRGLAVHAHPRVLARPQRPVAAAPAAVVAVAVQATVPIDAPPPAQPARVLEEAFDAARAQGLQEGREAGLQLGLKDAQARLEEATEAAKAAAAAQLERESVRLSKQWADRLARLDAVVKTFEIQLPQQWARLEVDAVELAFEVACRVLGDAAGRRQLIEDMVAQAMSAVRAKPLRVRLSAADLALIDTGAAHGPSLRERHAGVEWIADPEVQTGGCLIDGDGGTLDARLEVQLRRLLQQWKTATVRESDA
jgi:flagellar assembly protein FliH